MKTPPFLFFTIRLNTTSTGRIYQDNIFTFRTLEPVGTPAILLRNILQT